MSVSTDQYKQISIEPYQQMHF